MTDRELMQQALVALGAMQSYAAAEKKGLRICDEAIEALRNRLEKWTADDTAYRPGGLPQEEQELVTWARVNMNDHKEGDLGIGTVKWDASAPLVVHPHPAFQATQPQPSEAEVCCQDFEKCVRSCTPRGQWIAHVRCGCGDQIMPDDGAECGNCVTARKAVKREWQTLTDDEIRIAWGPYFSRGVDVARVIEALLKKKNS